MGIVVIADPGTVPINSRQGVFNREKIKIKKKNYFNIFPGVKSSGCT